MTATKNDPHAALLQAIRLKKAQAGKRAQQQPQLPARPSDQPAYASELQRSLWLAHQMAPNSAAYNLASALRVEDSVVEGSLDVDQLGQALTRVVRRHRILRSTFRADGDAVVQVIQPPKQQTVEVLTAEKFQDQQHPSLKMATREASQPFDLEVGPLLRLCLIEDTKKGERGETILLLVLHHILADERSLGFLWQELAEAYAGRRLPETEPQPQFDDHVYQLRQKDPAAQQPELDYWRRRLTPLPDDLQLPFAGTFNDATHSSNEPTGRLLSVAIESAEGTVQTRISQLAAASGATPFMVYAFAFRLLLQRYTPGQNVAFATPVSTRSELATADMIGYFSNPLIVNTAVDEASSIEQGLRDFSADLRDALGHSSIPFQHLAEQLSPPRQSDRSPLFQAMFVYQETSPPPKLGNARLQPVTLDLGDSKFDLTLFVSASKAGLEVAVEYRADRYDEPWMQQLLGHYRALLETVTEDFGRTLTLVSHYDASELLSLRAQSSGQKLSPPPDTALPWQIFKQVQSSPEAPAVHCGGVSLSYGELGTTARAIAQQLKQQGTSAGDRVALFLDRSPLMIAGLLATHWLDAAYVPMDPEYPPARHRYQLEDAEVSAVLTIATRRDQLPTGGWAVIEVDHLDAQATGEITDCGITDFDVTGWTPAEVAPGSLAYLLYTSGSTGNPKGVVVTHDNLAASNAARQQYFGTTPKRFLLLSSISFDSSVAGLFWALAGAGALVIPTDDEAKDPRRLAHLIAEQRVDSLLCVPSLYAELLRADSDALSTLEIAIVAGESCSTSLLAEHFARLPQTRLFNEYGPTEGTVWATAHEFTPQDVNRPVSIGRPIPGCRVEVLDAFERLVPAGIPGEIRLTGPTVAQGYWRLPELTAERFVAGETGAQPRRYRTGDLASWTLDGRLLFLGRQDEQIKLRGFRIEPAEIEAAVLRLPGVEQATIVARQVGSIKALVAFVRMQGDAEVANWRQDLSAHLPRHLIPSRVIPLPELPQLPNGKVDLQRLRDLPVESAADSTQEVEPAVLSTNERTLLSLWQGLLGQEAISPADNFFELGGHSLLVVEMTRVIERDFEVTLTPADVFENPTIAELAQRLEQQFEQHGGARQPPYQHLFPLQPRGDGMPVIFAVPHFFSFMFAERFRGERPVYGLRGVSLRSEGNRGRWPTMSDLGDDLVNEIQRRFPGQKILMVGYSFGASMAVEAVRLMEQRGLPVQRLYLIAPMPVDFYSLGPLRLQLDDLDRPLTEFSTTQALAHWLGDNHPLSRRFWSRLHRRLVVDPRRRWQCFLGKRRLRQGLPLTPEIMHADVRLERFRLHSGYQPGVVRTPTVVFNAQEAATDAAATWRPYFEGPFTAIPTPDPHLGDASAEAARQLILQHLKDLDED